MAAKTIITYAVILATCVNNIVVRTVWMVACSALRTSIQLPMVDNVGWWGGIFERFCGIMAWNVIPMCITQLVSIYAGWLFWGVVWVVSASPFDTAVSCYEISNTSFYRASYHVSVTYARDIITEFLDVVITMCIRFWATSTTSICLLRVSRAQAGCNPSSSRYRATFSITIGTEIASVTACSRKDICGACFYRFGSSIAWNNELVRRISFRKANTFSLLSFPLQQLPEIGDVPFQIRDEIPPLPWTVVSTCANPSATAKTMYLYAVSSPSCGWSKMKVWEANKSSLLGSELRDAVCGTTYIKVRSWSILLSWVRLYLWLFTVTRKKPAEVRRSESKTCLIVKISACESCSLPVIFVIGLSRSLPIILRIPSARK